MFLTIYDISGIQKFIFATGKLKEQVGGSNIVHKIMYETLPSLLNDEGVVDEGWRELDYNPFDFSRKKIKGNVVYIGGGNAMAAFEDEATMMKVTREMQKEVYKLTAGNIRLCYAKVEVLDKEQKYGDIYQALVANMALFKQTHSAVSSTGGFAINALDVNTGEPVVRCQDGEVRAASLKSKRNNADDGKLLIMDKLDFTKHFEKHRNPDDKSFVAVAHIDGNSMGKNIQAFIGKLDQNPASTVATSLCQMKLLSQEIDKLYKEALVKTVKEVYEDQGKEVAFRPVIRDGDDITFIIEAKKAFEFVKIYMTKLSEEIKDEKAYPIMTGSEMKVSAGAGITFVHDKFPFDVAYDYTEQLCKSAKTKLKELSGDDKIPESTSCLDFQVIRSSMGDNIAEYREKRYRFRDNKDDGDIYSLEKRPYFFVDKGTDIKGTDISGIYADFESLFAFVGESGDNKNLARNKLKMLRNAYSEGVQAANDCYALIKSRDKGGVAGDGRTAFNENKVAEFFDVLDVMDFV
jgi:hypothetical protein